MAEMGETIESIYGLFTDKLFKAMLRLCVGRGALCCKSIY